MPGDPYRAYQCADNAYCDVSEKTKARAPHDLSGEPTRKQANHQNDKKFLSKDGRFHRVEAAIGIIRGLKPLRHAVEVALDAAPTRRKPNAEAP